MQNQEQTPDSSQNLNSFTPQHKESNVRRLISILSIVALLAVAGVAGFMYLQEKNAHSATNGKLGTTTSQLEDKSRLLDEANKVLGLKKFDDAIMASLKPNTDRECRTTNSSSIFNVTTSSEKNPDGSVKKLFGVAQYICVKGNEPTGEPIRFAAVQSYDGGVTWKFTYGSSTANPDNLPNYIYNTDPALFDAAYDKPGHN